MLKRIVLDPAFLFLIAINAWCIWYYENNPDEFNTLLFLYWGQSVLIGFFNIADLLTVKNIIPGSMKLNNTPVENTATSKGCAAGFFAFHYGGFHLAYGIFILIYTRLKIDFNFVLLGLAAFSLSLVIEFMRHKQWQRNNQVNLGTMFFLPYLRIVPMHLMIMGPAFLKWEASSIFLILKTAADVIMYLITSPVHKARTTETFPKSGKIT